MLSSFSVSVSQAMKLCKREWNSVASASAVSRRVRRSVALRVTADHLLATAAIVWTRERLVADTARSWGPVESLAARRVSPVARRAVIVGAFVWMLALRCVNLSSWARAVSGRPPVGLLTLSWLSVSASQWRASWSSQAYVRLSVSWPCRVDCFSYVAAIGKLVQRNDMQR